jgi:hypothetical protein
MHWRPPRDSSWREAVTISAPSRPATATAVGHIGSHASAVGGKCLHQHEGRARGARSKRRRIRQSRDAPRGSGLRPRLPISSELRFGMNSGATPRRPWGREGACQSPDSGRPASAPALSLSLSCSSRRQLDRWLPAIGNAMTRPARTRRPRLVRTRRLVGPRRAMCVQALGGDGALRDSALHGGGFISGRAVRQRWAAAHRAARSAR